MSIDIVSELLERIDADLVKFIRLQFSDIQGLPKNVAIPAAQAEKALTEGIWFDGSSIEGFCRIEESDMLLKPDPSTYAILPWRPENGRVARFICDLETYGGKPFEGDPRYVLRKTIAEAAEMGFTFSTGPELEFFLFAMRNGLPSTEFADFGGYFDLAPNDAAEDVRRQIVVALTDMGFDIEASHHEVASSQHEIDFKYAEALVTADRVITFKFATKAIALRENLHATFMAKPIAGIAGTGMHIHGSLMKEGKNAFYDPDGTWQLSETCRHWIGGLLKHAPAITRVANPTINSYKRLVPGYEAPVYISWSNANRSALIRVPSARGMSTRAEFRSPDPMCNPYLTFAAMLAAGLDGIRNRIDPGDPTDVNIYHLSDAERRERGIEMLPSSLYDAHQAMLGDDVIRNALGDHVVSGLDALTTAEWDSFRMCVHPWEHERYLAIY